MSEVYFIGDENDLVLCKTGWIFEGQCAIPLDNQNSAITATPASLIENLKNGYGGGSYQIESATSCSLVESSVPVGQFHPRIFRPVSALSGSPVDNVILTNANSRLKALLDFLETICRTVYPESKLNGLGEEVGNLAIYGHDIRNGMLMACTEVEAQLKGILRANHIRAESTADYVKLCGTLRLRDYEIDFLSYSCLNNRRPFDSWDALLPSKSIAWYDAYNAVKHDRESDFPKARLEHLIDSIAAVAILLVAQFGPDRVRLGSMALTFSHEWQLDDYYIAPFALRHSEDGLAETEADHRARTEALCSRVDVTP